MMESNKYDDIINMKHHVSDSRKRMSIYDRAAQFSPFAALTGYDEVVREEARITENRIELDEGSKQIINEKLMSIYAQISNHPKITVTYFLPDKYKSGGEYVTVTGQIKNINKYNKNIIMSDGSEILINDIISLECRD